MHDSSNPLIVCKIQVDPGYEGRLVAMMETYKWIGSFMPFWELKTNPSDANINLPQFRLVITEADLVFLKLQIPCKVIKSS